MDNMRNNPSKMIGSFKVEEIRDYKEKTTNNLITGEKGKTDLPESNVLYYELEDNAWCCVRPSGTEPKIKFYIGVKGKTEEEANQKLEELKRAMLNLAEEI